MDYILFENSAYARLGFTSIDGMNATDADFKSARKKVVLESHSDKLGDVLGRIPTPDEIQAAKERPALANAAYDIVKDPNARKEHDKAILQNPLRKTELTKAVEIFRNARATSAFQDFEAGEALRKKHGFTQDELNIEDKRQADIEARSAQAAAQAVQRSANTGSAFKSAAQTAGAKAQPSAAQQAKEKSEELGRLLGRILNNPKDKDDRTRFLDEVRRVVLDADWLILLAMHNQTPERLTRNNREYRAVLGILAEAMAANSDIAKSKRFTAAIEPFIFAGLDNAPRAPYETQAMDLFKAALAINPEIFSDEGVEAYCRRTHEPYGDKISVDIVLEILKKRPELAFATLPGLVDKMANHLEDRDANNKPYKVLYEHVLQMGVIDSSWFDAVSELNERKPAIYANGDKGGAYHRVNAFIAEQRKSRFVRPDTIYGAGKNHEHYRR